ncbi:MAG: tyrosine--tRNA ligase [Synergistaceae bacterium]|nr:tyrosine--tRNA ligase [Synergistaceae bacterium]MDD2350519.1 tyrosine--tRNA ligase [Synergistaceae bacterium]MDD3318793.1 tyrosine--tRNA ligase [Synergistaceae bacterium]MDD3963718.1 tyrosine--tRNA ligase [Synergistaceae bacterium]MDD4704776.1 tyrosine--tRNA ligase [Synergistaceae bacterium]
MHSNALKVLKERGFVEWSSHNEELDEHFLNNMVTGYIGFDPSADSLHVGNLVAIMGLAWMQRLGHRPIALAGGGTGRIGDPSGKSAERNLLSEEQISYNVERIAKQLEHFLDFNCGENSALLVNNNEWLKKLNYIEFLRDTGKYFSVSFLVNRDYVRSRVVDPDKSITYTELSYILLQAYDFNHMYNELNCTLQMGGNDQQVNIIAGMDLARKKSGGQCYGITFPLLLNAQGQKFGKSESGAVYLSPHRTSIYKFYQFWINVDDSDLEKLYKLFTFMELDEIRAIIEEHNKNPHLRVAQKKLAWDLTCRVHGEDAAKRAKDASAILFGEMDIREADAELLDTLSAEIPFAEADSIIGGPITDLLVLSGGCASKGEAKRKIKEGGVYLNGVKVTEESKQISSEDLLKGGYVQLRVGKKDFRLVKFRG